MLINYKERKEKKVNIRKTRKKKLTIKAPEQRQKIDLLPAPTWNIKNYFSKFL